MVIRVAPYVAAALLLAAASLPSARAHAIAPGAAAAAAQKKIDQSFDGKGGPVFHLLGFSLGGSKRIDPDAIVAQLPQHKGDVITRAEVKEDAERLGVILNTHHIHGDITAAILEQEGLKGHQIWVVYDIQLRDALSDVPLRKPRHFASQSFSGNSALTTDQLIAITGMHAGDRMRDGKLSDLRTAIEQAYDKVLPGKPVAVKGKVKLRKDDTIVISWEITEPK